MCTSEIDSSRRILGAKNPRWFYALSSIGKPCFAVGIVGLDELDEDEGYLQATYKRATQLLPI